MTVVTTDLVRGNTLHVAAVFTDYLGNPANPGSVNVSFNYVSNGSKTTQTYAMAFSAGFWVYDWDTQDIQPGLIQWSVFTQLDELPVYVADGCFNLDANSANLGAIT